MSSTCARATSRATPSTPTPVRSSRSARGPLRERNRPPSPSSIERHLGVERAGRSPSGRLRRGTGGGQVPFRAHRARCRGRHRCRARGRSPARRARCRGRRPAQAREVHEDSGRLVGQVPRRWVRSSEGSRRVRSTGGQVCGDQICQRIALHAHGDSAVPDARCRLRLQDHKLAAHPPHDLSVELHHSIAGIQVSAAAERATCMNLGDHGPFRRALDRNLLLGGERSLPERPELDNTAGRCDALQPNRDASQGASDGVRQWFESGPARQERKSTQGCPHRPTDKRILHVPQQPLREPYASCYPRSPLER
jgi:hypothetical protein